MHELFGVVLYNGIVYIQVFYAIAGYILVVQIMTIAAAKVEERFRFYPLAVIYRFLR